MLLKQHMSNFYPGKMAIQFRGPGLDLVGGGVCPCGVNTLTPYDQIW